MVKNFVEFIFYSSIYISICAVAMCLETNLLMHLPLNKPGFYYFVFGGVMVQYNLHYFVKKSSHRNSSHFEWSQRNRKTHLLLAGTGLLMIIMGIFTFRFHHLFVVCILGVITMLYSLPLLPFTGKKRLKDFGILKIITLVLFWTIITTWFPIDQVNETHRSFLLIFMGRFIFLFALCLVFDIRDHEIDTRENIRTIPVIIGKERTYNLVNILLGVFIMLIAIQYWIVPGLAHLNAMILSAGATFIIIGYIKKKSSDIAYLACLDGMMLLQALLIMIGSI